MSHVNDDNRGPHGDGLVGETDRPSNERTDTIAEPGGDGTAGRSACPGPESGEPEAMSMPKPPPPQTADEALVRWFCCDLTPSERCQWQLANAANAVRIAEAWAAVFGTR